MTEIFSAAVLLLLVIDPFGNVPIVVSALANVAPERRAKVILRECAAAYVILLAFMFGGQAFLSELLAKVRTARQHVRSGHLQLRIEVDGGISESTIEAAAEAGADAFVAGTAVFGADDPAAAVRSLRRLAEQATTVG